MILEMRRAPVQLNPKDMQQFFRVLRNKRPEKHGQFLSFLKRTEQEGNKDHINELWPDFAKKAL